MNSSSRECVCVRFSWFLAGQLISPWYLCLRCVSALHILDCDPQIHSDQFALWYVSVHRLPYSFLCHSKPFDNAWPPSPTSSAIPLSFVISGARVSPSTYFSSDPATTDFTHSSQIILALSAPICRSFCSIMLVFGRCQRFWPRSHSGAFWIHHPTCHCRPGRSPQ